MNKPVALIVDDERVIADTVAIILNQHGIDASAVYNGTEAIEAARRLQPQFILMDVGMPGINGIEAAKRIVTERPECKIVIFSGIRATADLLNQAREEGYEFEVLAKPLHPSALLGLLHTVGIPKGPSV